MVVHAAEGLFWGSITWPKHDRSKRLRALIVDGDGKIVHDSQVRVASAVRIEFHLDGSRDASAAPYAWSWDVSADQAGEHALIARAVGSDEHVAEAALKVTVTPTSPPVP